jgi:ankyrin repeat protein
MQDVTILEQVNAQDILGATPLHWAARRGDLEATAALLRAGAKIELSTSEGMTPLFSALTNPQATCVDILLEAGANVNAEGVDGRRSVHYACERNHLVALQKMHLAGADLDHKSTIEQLTPLVIAAYFGRSSIVQYLIQNGASLDAADKWGVVAVHRAVRSSRIDVLRLLLDAGAKYDHSENDNSTILHNAAEYADLQTIEYLALANFKGLDINKRDDNNQTALDVLNTRCVELAEPEAEALKTAFEKLFRSIGSSNASTDDAEIEDVFFDAVQELGDI